MEHRTSLAASIIAGLIGGAIVGATARGGDPLAFLGAVVGAAATIYAGYLAWTGIQSQLALQQKSIEITFVMARESAIVFEYRQSLDEYLTIAAWLEDFNKLESPSDIYYVSERHLRLLAKGLSAPWPPDGFSIYEIVKKSLPNIDPVDRHALAVDWDSLFKISHIMVNDDHNEAVATRHFKATRALFMADLERLIVSHNERMKELAGLRKKLALFANKSHPTTSPAANSGPKS